MRGVPYLGAHPVSDEASSSDSFLLTREDLGPLQEYLEQESKLWANLATAPPLEAPAERHEFAAKHLDAQLRHWVALRDRWEESFGHLAMLMRSIRGWDPLEFTSFAHYCEERLGMAPRTVAQRASLERRLHDVPVLRQAMRERRLSYEKARLLARGLALQEIAGWIGRAEGMTCIELRRALEDEEERQMCARGAFRVWLPPSVALLVSAAFRAARSAAGRRISPAECLVRIAQHFIEVWKPGLARKQTLARRIRERDKHRCQVPGCSRAAKQTHHVEFLSQGGSDDPSNQAGVCAGHHLRGIHEGRLRVTGTAPDQLRWVLADGEVFRGGARVAKS